MQTAARSVIAWCAVLAAILCHPGAAAAQPVLTTEPAATPAVVAFTLAIQPDPTPEPLPAPTPEPIEIADYALNEKDVDWLARLAFLSPLTAPENKAALMWLVLNRVDSADFPATVRQVISQRGEFGFWDADKLIRPENLSANRELAKLVLNQWLSEKDGLNAGRLIPKEALFLRFSGEGNRNIELLPDRWGEPLYWPVKGAYEY